jgi:hypothetical protein
MHAGVPQDPCHLTVLVGKNGWVVCETTNPSPSTDRQYKDFKGVFLYKAGA